MQAFEFHIFELMHLPVGPVVIGRCGDADFGVGDVFTEVRWSVSELRGSPSRYELVAEDIVAEVRLRVEEISAYNRLINRVGSGLTAGIRFGGVGLEALGGIDFKGDFRAGKSWSLWGRKARRPSNVPE